MSLVNVAYNISFGWSKPEVQSLEAQMLEPLLNEHPVELGLAGRQASVCALLAADPEYRAAFAQAFPQESGPAVSFPNVNQGHCRIRAHLEFSAAHRSTGMCSVVTTM